MRILLWVLGSVIGLFLLIVLLLQVPLVQNFVKDKAVAYLEEKIGTEVRLDRITIGLPKKVILEDFYFEDQKQDTLLSGKRLSVNISLIKLLSNELEIHSVDLQGAVANISRDRDSVFNFDYIIDAFATPNDTAQSEPMKISVDRLNLDDITFRWNDAITRNDIRVKLIHFDTHFREFNLPKMKFNIPRIRLDGLDVMLNQGIVEEIAETSVEVVDTISRRPDFRIELGTIALSRISLGYDNKGTRLNTGVKLGKLLMEFNRVDMNRQLIELKKFDLEDLKGNLAIGKFDKEIKIPETDTTAIRKTGWKVALDQASVRGIEFKYDDDNYRQSPRGIDYRHLDISHFDLNAENLLYSDDTIAGRIDRFAVREASGLDLRELSTEFFYGEQGAYLNNLELETNRTSLREKIAVKYPSRESLTSSPGEIYIDADIRNSRISFADILLFAPDLQVSNPFKSNPNAVLRLNTRILGKINDIRFPDLQISGIGNTALSASGRITGLPDVKRAYFDVKINNLQTTRTDIVGIVPNGTLPGNITLPGQVSARGDFRGALDNFNTNLALSTSYGDARVKALFDSRRKNRERYDADVSVDNFDLGKLIGNDSIGRVTMTARVDGTGLQPKSATAKISTIINSAQYIGYTYRNFALDGTIDDGNYNLDAGMADPNLDFTIKAGGGFDDEYPSVRLKLNLDIADLEKLNLHAGPMKIRGNIDADIPESNPDFLNGTVSLHHIQFLAGDDPVILDSINIVATSTAERNTMKIRSQVLKADIEGKYKLTQIADAIGNTIAKYYNPAPDKARRQTDPQYFDFDLRVDDDPVIFKIVPQLTGLEPFNIRGHYNSEGDTIRVGGEIPRLVYAGNNISGASLQIDTKEGALVYDFNVDGIQAGQFSLPFTSLTGDLKDDIASFNLVLRDSGKKEQYSVTGNLETRNGDTELRIDPENLVLNYEKWTISPDNRLRFGKSGIFADNFQLSHENSSISLQSLSQDFNAPLELEFTDFNLETLFNMISSKDALAGGTLNGTAQVRNMSTQPEFIADLDITGFRFQDQPVGDLAVRVDNHTNDLLRADVQLTGEGNDMRIFGTYQTTRQALNLELDMNALQMKSAQGFTFGQVTDGEGFLSGQFRITGTVPQPRVVGDLNFNDVGLRVTQLNSFFGGINERVPIDAEGLRFDRFTISDEKGNDLVLNGRVRTQNYRDFGFDLTVNAYNFRAVNSKASDNDLYYGDLFLDADLAVNGTLDSPEVSGNIKINEDTAFSVVLPQSDPSIADREGIVEFVDEQNMLLQETVILKNELDKTEVRGVDVSVHIQIVKEAVLSLIIDKGNGDYLNLQGEADLTGGIDRSGKTTLTGKYEFTEGAYEMSFNLLRRKFDIKPGSYIIWNGEPTQATIDITAIYNVDAAPIDLVGDQLAGVSQSVRNTYKQRIPFETHLKMNGALLRPVITFDIVLPDGNYAVSSEIVTVSQTKLEQMRRDPAEMNKQVFALLLLNRFIGENPFASEAGSASPEAMARQSVSKILSQQLNNIAADLIKGVELNFELESTEDYTTGIRENRTDLNVGVSKKMLDDRLNVTVGSSFGLEGQQNQNEQANNIAGNISAEYQLTKDGRYMVRAYRKNEYQVALQGQVVETGLAFVITMDYNKFRELFHRTEEEKEMKRRERERRRQEREANIEPDNKPALNIEKDED